MLENSTILVTGGAGSFGSKFIPMTLEKYNPNKIINLAEANDIQEIDTAVNYGSSQDVIGSVKSKIKVSSKLPAIDLKTNNIEKKLIEIILIFQYHKFQKLGHHRWTLDEEEDFKLIKIIYKNLYKKGRIFKSQEILDFLDGDASLSKINSHIIRNEGYKKSLENDQVVQ